MAFYRERVMPFLIDYSMRGEDFAEQRRGAVADAKGSVLEIGFGTGLNLPFYPPAVTKVIALDPVRPPSRVVERNLPKTTIPLEFIQGAAERIPLPEASVDTVVSTWTLCSVDRPESVLIEISRVLKPKGVFLFVEHGLSPERRVAFLQHALTPLQKRLAGGCHLDRDIDKIIRSSPLDLSKMENLYMRGPRPFTFLYRGQATKA